MPRTPNRSRWPPAATTVPVLLARIERANRHRQRLHRREQRRDRSRYCASSLAAVRMRGVEQELGSKEADALGAGVEDAVHFVGDLQVGLERIRTPSAVVGGPSRAGRRAARVRPRAAISRAARQRRAPRPTARSTTSPAGAVDAPAVWPGAISAASRRRGRRPPGCRASAPGSRCDASDRRRRRRGRARASSRAAPQPTAAARRRPG